MQISKAFLTLCAVALLILPPFVRGAETDAQAKARKALEEKLKQLESGTATPEAPVTTTPAPAVTPPPAAAPVAPAPTAAPTTLDDKTREAMRQKLNELQSPPPATVIAEPAPAAAPAPVQAD